MCVCVCPQTSDESDNYHGFELCLVSTETEPAPEIPKKADDEENETTHLIIIIVLSALGSIIVCSAIYHYSTSKSNQEGSTSNPNAKAGKIGQLIF